MGSLIRWEPFTDMTRLRREMNRLLEDFFGEGAEETAPEVMRIPSVDVLDRENEIVIRAEMPGIDKENIQLQAMPEALQIRAETRKESEEKGENYLRRERRMGVFQRIVPMPAEIKPDAVKAHYKDGVLEITLPKSEQAKSHQPVKINIE
ncbi:MAG: Hsp20/alpha crystallin family protein [Armatimonadota bacterium]